MASVTVSLPEILGAAAATVAIGSGAAGLYRWCGNRYRRSIGSRRDLARRFSQLAAGVTTRYIEERFGAPAFVRDFGAGANLTEQVYHTRHAWLQILTDEHDAVVRFSITVTDPRFRLQAGDLTLGQLGAKIGHTRFADIRSALNPEGRSLRIAARRREYSESYWFGNPGNSQHYVLSHNDAGPGEFGFSIMQEGIGWFQEGILKLDYAPPVEMPKYDPDAPYARRFRAQTVVNTLTILGAGHPETILAEPRGADADHVRVLVPDARERRRLRRRMRRVNRQVLREIKRQTAQEAPETGEIRCHRHSQLQASPLGRLHARPRGVLRTSAPHVPALQLFLPC